MQTLIQTLNKKLVASPFYAFSYYKDMDLKSTQPSFKHKDLIIKESNVRQALPEWNPNTLAFGAQPTDHMLTIDWTKENGWEAPVIRKFEDFKISPFNSTLHYALECFEGTKAFRTEKGIRLFRCDANMFRMKGSMNAVTLPDFDGHELQKCIQDLIKLDQLWVPPVHGFSLYLRPTGIAMEASLGVKAPGAARLFTVCSPVGPYYPSGFKPIKLYCDPDHFRAAPYGNGNKKIGGNYGPTIPPSTEAAKKGYHQILWLWEGQVCEVGTSNIFFFWVNEQGEKELVTPRLDEGYILPGVTRDSILDITRSWGKFKVTERQLHMDEIAKASKEGRLIEAFGAGTAVIVCPIEEINYKGESLKIPINPKHNAGDLTKEILEFIQDIQYGKRDYKDWQTDIILSEEEIKLSQTMHQQTQSQSQNA